MKMKKKYIGAHFSIAGGMYRAIERAIKFQANACAFFLKNQMRWKAIPYSKEIIKKFKKCCKKNNFSADQILPHSSYLMNLGHPSNYLLKKSRFFFIDEIIRCRKLGLKFLNFHPGSHLRKINEEDCLLRISNSINLALDQTQDVILVIENTAGQGSNVGYNFFHLAKIIENVKNKNRIGICIDTCHLFASGYNINSQEGYESTFELLDRIVGLNYLKGIHLNNSKTKLNSRIDRHENLKYGYIKKDFFSWIMKDSRFHSIPIILETKDKNLWKKEISWLRSKI